VVQPDPLVGNRFLQLGLTSVHPGTGLDAGEAGQSRQRLRVVREDIVSGDVTVTGFRTKVTMLSAAVTPCLTTTSPTRAMAHAVFVFFNDGRSTSSADLTGDVFAGFNVENRSTSGRLIEAFIARCTNASCSATAGLKGVTFDRSWKIGVAVPLTVVWDRELDRFIYTAGAEQPVLTYGDVPLADSTPPVVDTRDLQVRNVLPQCSTPVKCFGDRPLRLLAPCDRDGRLPLVPTSRHSPSHPGVAVCARRTSPSASCRARTNTLQ
jgi:hypothetical protein